MVLIPQGGDQQPGPDVEQQLATLVLAAFRQNTQEELDALLASPALQQQSVVEIYSELGLNPTQIAEVRKNPQLFLACLAYARENPAEVEDSIQAICTFYETALQAGRTAGDIEGEMAPVLIGHDSPPELVPGNEGGEAGEGSGTNPLLPPEEEDLPSDYVVGNEYDGDGLEDGNSGILGSDGSNAEGDGDVLLPTDSGMNPSAETGEGNLVAMAGVYAKLLRRQGSTIEEISSATAAEQLAAAPAFSTLLERVPEELNNPDGLTDIAYLCTGIRLDENATDDLREAAKTIEGGLRMRSLSLLQQQGSAMLPLHSLALHAGLHPRILETKLTCELELVGPNQYVTEEALEFMSDETMYGSQGPTLPAEEEFYSSVDYDHFSAEHFKNDLKLAIDAELDEHVFYWTNVDYSLSRTYRALPVIAHALQRNRETLQYTDCFLEAPGHTHNHGSVVETKDGHYVCIPLTSNAATIQSSINTALEHPVISIKQRVGMQSEASTIPVSALNNTHAYENPGHTLAQLERIDFPAILEGIDVPSALEGRLDIYVNSVDLEAYWELDEGVYSIFVSLEDEERRNMEDAELADDVRQQIQDVIDDLYDITVDDDFEDEEFDDDDEDDEFDDEDDEPPFVPDIDNTIQGEHPILQQLDRFPQEEQQNITELVHVAAQYQDWVTNLELDLQPVAVPDAFFETLEGNRYTRFNSLRNEPLTPEDHQERCDQLTGRIQGLFLAPSVQGSAAEDMQLPPVPQASEVDIQFAAPLLEELYRLDRNAWEEAQADAYLLQRYRGWLGECGPANFPCPIPQELYSALPFNVAAHFEQGATLERAVHEQICDHIHEILFQRLRVHIPRNVSKGRKLFNALLISTLVLGGGVVGFFGRGAVVPSTNAINPAGVERNDDGTSTHARAALAGKTNDNNTPFTGATLEDEPNPVEVVERGGSVEFGEGSGVVVTRIFTNNALQISVPETVEGIHVYISTDDLVGYRSIASGSPQFIKEIDSVSPGTKIAVVTNKQLEAGPSFYDEDGEYNSAIWRAAP